MQRVLTYTFLCISMMLAWWALELQMKLVSKEKQIRQLRSEAIAAMSAQAKAEAVLAPLNENIARLTTERDEARATVEKGAQPAPAADANASVLDGLFKQMESPEMKEMIRSQELAATRKEYNGLLKKWALAPAELDAVLNALADKEAGSASAQTQAREAANARLAALLGDERMKELDAFDREKEKEAVVGRYSEHLDIVGFPLNPQQRDRLAEIIEAESASKPEREARALALMTNREMTNEALAKFRKTEEDKQSRIVRQAAGVLSPDQVSGLQSAFREENQEQDSAMRIIWQTFKAGTPDFVFPMTR